MEDAALEEPAEQVIDRQVEFFGAAADYWQYTGLEALLESGAGTGKSFCAMKRADYQARTYPGCRILFARETRVSMDGTVLPDWRESVLWPGHPAISRTASIEGQDVYRYPNGSTIWLAGLNKMVDTGNPILSAQFDFIYIFQAEETKEEAYQKLKSRLGRREGITPYVQITLDVNPGAPSHWINRTFEDEGENRKRFRFRHQDNPVFFDHETGEWTKVGRNYVGTVLGSLRGVTRDRLLHHRWVAEEGLIFTEYDESIHLVTGEFERHASFGWWLHIDGQPQPVHLRWFGAGVDFGYFPDPGAIVVYGYDAQKRRYRVAEVCRLSRQIDWWAEVASELFDRWECRYFACDPSRPSEMATIATRMTPRKGRPGGVVIGADNTLRGSKESKQFVGIDLMKWGFRDENGEPRTFIVKDTFPRGLDSELDKIKRPMCFEQEVLEYVYAKTLDGSFQARPDSKCDDHVLDATRYEAMEGWGRDLSEKIQAPKFDPGSFGARLGH